MQRDRAATREGGERSRTVDYLRAEVADRMMERLLDIKRAFNTILDLGSGPGHFTKLIQKDRAQKVVMLDSSEATLNRDPDSEFEGVLVQIRKALKPDGLFLGAMLGGDTLFELRTSLQLAQVEREGGISPHVSPMTDTRDMTNLLGRAGFTLLTVDTDEVKVGYPSMWELLEDLQDMGERNAILGRRSHIPRDTLIAASSIYKGGFATVVLLLLEERLPAARREVVCAAIKPSTKFDP
ncbi:hypothetical protein ONZ45_g4903 [Pleurotus djamor]|nr:hypothetical protein ONZ45_g4903 [Pleurotus djamor]